MNKYLVFHYLRILDIADVPCFVFWLFAGEYQPINNAGNRIDQNTYANDKKSCLFCFGWVEEGGNSENEQHHGNNVGEEGDLGPCPGVAELDNLE